MRMMWPLENANTSPSALSTREMKRSARSATSSGDFAARTAVAKQFPAGPILVDFGGQFSLEAAVIPLHQIGVCLGDIAEAGQLTCPAGALQWARKDLRKGELPQPLADLASALFAAFIQRQVGSTSLAARISPLRIAMPREEQSGQLLGTPTLFPACTWQITEFGTGRNVPDRLDIVPFGRRAARLDRSPSRPTSSQ